jgi:hypothetical protein
MKPLIAIVFLLLLSASAARAQDLPPLPPAAGTDETQVTAGSGVVISTPNGSTDNVTIQTSSSDNSAPALPPLPSSSDSTQSQPGSTTNSGVGLPPLPGASSNSSGTNGSAGLPPLPNASSNSTGGQTESSSGSGVGLPPLPGTASSPSVAATPFGSSPTVHAKRKLTPQQKYWADHYRPNVIYGGWVKPKGGEVDARLAWVSQEVINAVTSMGFTVAKEEGNYEGQPGIQWRQWTFQSSKTDVTPQVYIKPLGNRVWLRVGPPEAPAGLTLSQVQAIQRQDQKVLRVVRLKLGRRLSPHHRGNWDAPYSTERESADE